MIDNTNKKTRTFMMQCSKCGRGMNGKSTECETAWRKELEEIGVDLNNDSYILYVLPCGRHIF